MISRACGNPDISVKDSDFTISRGFYFHEIRENKTLAKIFQFTVFSPIL